MNKKSSSIVYYLFFISYSLLSIVSGSTSAQISPSKYFIRFTDKNNSPYTISSPSGFLSAKAIARRTTQGILIAENDLPVNPQYVDSIVSKGAKVLTRSKWFNGVTINITDSATLNAVNALPFVLSSNPVQLRRANNSATINSFKNETFTASHLELMRIAQTFDYGTSYTQTKMIRLDSLHAQGYHGEGKTIAMMDDGFYNVDSIAAFDSLRINNQLLGTWDFVEGDADVFRDTVFGLGNAIHGMFTLSVIGGNLPGQLVGTAPKANFLLLRTEQAASEHIIEEYNWAAAAEYADSAGADIFSTSLIYTTFDGGIGNHTYSSMDGKTCPMTIAAEVAASKGILVINSAGNDGNSGWQYIGTPADGDSVLTVGSVDTMGVYSSFSSKGPTADGRIKPNVVAQGSGTIGAHQSGGTVALGGTSFSCPIIAGAAACLWQKYPTASNMQIFRAIEESASQFLTPDTLLGYGIPDFYQANILLSGITQLHTDASISVYPNPAHDMVTIVYNYKEADATLRITDMLGNIVSTRRISEPIYHLDVNMLSRGVYILQIISNEGTLFTKIVKQ